MPKKKPYDEPTSQFEDNNPTNVAPMPFNVKLTSHVEDDDDKNYNFQQDAEYILKSYRKKFNREPQTDEQGYHILKFKSEKEAYDFFQEMANQNRSFLALEVDSKGNYTGNYMYSLGDGKLLTGTLAPTKIGSLVNQFERLAKAKTSHRQAEAIKGIGEVVNPQEESNQENKDNEYSSPTPFNPRPW